MSIVEFRRRIILIDKFIKKMNAENIPGNVKPIMLKLYASSLKIHLSDTMACNMLKGAYA